MIRPILACKSPYETAKRFESAGWNIDFSEPPESGDPLVGVSLFGNSLLLGVADGYVAQEHMGFIGCGVTIYMTVPREEIERIHRGHMHLNPTDVKEMPWRDSAFEVTIGGFAFMIAAR